MNKTRGKLLALSAAGLLAALLLPVQVAALTLMGVCFLGGSSSYTVTWRS